MNYFLIYFLYICRQLDEFPVNEKVALQLAGLHAQVLWGDYDIKMISRYNDLEQYLHPRLMGENKNRSKDEWKNEISKAHNVSQTFIIITII